MSDDDDLSTLACAICGAQPVVNGLALCAIHHLAFEADSRDEVDDRAAWVRTQGVEIESGPQEYAYIPGYYATFFYDPDGLKLEIVHIPGLVAA